MNNTIGKIIREERVKKNISQSGLGMMTGISRQQMSNYESGLKPLPVKHIVTLARAVSATGEYSSIYPVYDEDNVNRVVQLITDAMREKYKQELLEMVTQLKE